MPQFPELCASLHTTSVYAKSRTRQLFCGWIVRVDGFNLGISGNIRISQFTDECHRRGAVNSQKGWLPVRFGTPMYQMGHLVATCTIWYT